MARVRRINTGNSATIEQTIDTVIGETYFIAVEIFSYSLTPTITLDGVDVADVVHTGINFYSFVATKNSYTYGLNTALDDVEFTDFTCVHISQGLLFENFTEGTWERYLTSVGYPDGIQVVAPLNVISMFTTPDTPKIATITQIGGDWTCQWATESITYSYSSGTEQQLYTIQGSYQELTLTVVDIDTLTAFSIIDQFFTQNSVDNALLIIANSVLASPRAVAVTLTGNAPPQTGGLASKTIIEDAGGTVLVDFGFGGEFNLFGTVYSNNVEDLSAQTSVAYDILFSATGNSMYILGFDNNTIYQYSLSSPYDSQSAIYTGNSLTPSGQETESYGMTFNGTGSKFYLTGDVSGSVHQYNLGTNWNIGTAVFSQSLDLDVADAFAGNPVTIQFSINGLNMYILNFNDDKIYQYELSSAWDISTAVYGIKVISATVGGFAATTFELIADGLHMFTIGENDVVKEWLLGVAWDISTASQRFETKDISLQTTSSYGLAFSSSGGTMFVLGTDAKVYEYSLALFIGGNDSARMLIEGTSSTPQNSTITVNGSPWTMVWDGVYATQYTSGVGNHAYGVVPNGVHMLLGVDNMNSITDLSAINQGYTELSVDNILAAVATSVGDNYRAIDVTLTGNNPPSSNGLSSIVTIEEAGGVVLVDVATPLGAWDVASATLTVNDWGILTEDTNTLNVAFSPDGLHLYKAGSQNNTIYQYDMSPAWDITSLTYANKSKPIGTEEGTPFSLLLSDDGTKMYVGGTGSGKLFQYTLGTAWDVSTATYDTIFMSTTTEDATPHRMVFGDNGSKLYINGTANEFVYQYTLGTPWDINTASYSTKSHDVNPEMTWLDDTAFSSDGTKMFCNSAFEKKIFQYTLGTAWDVGTATYDTVFFDWKAAIIAENSVRMMKFKPDGLYMYLVGWDDDLIYEFDLSA